MHPVTESADADPVIVSLSGSVFLSAPVVTAFQSGELEPEGAFARFYGTCHALGPHWFNTKQLEAHEAFWCFGDVVRSGRFSGDLAWFQTGVYDLSTALVSVPLLVHASGVAVEQLGPCTFTSVRVQVPATGRRFDEEAVLQLVDQFSALADVDTTAVEIRAQLMSRARPERWTVAAAAWFEDICLEPLAVQDLAISDDRVYLDDRWAFRQSPGTCTAVFSAPGWSLSAASTITVLMVEAARSAGINGTFVVDVSCA